MYEIAKRQDVLVRDLLLPVTVKTKHVLRFPVPVVELAAMMTFVLPGVRTEARNRVPGCVTVGAHASVRGIVAVMETRGADGVRMPPVLRFASFRTAREQGAVSPVQTQQDWLLIIAGHARIIRAAPSVQPLSANLPNVILTVRQVEEAGVTHALILTV